MYSTTKGDNTYDRVISYMTRCDCLSSDILNLTVSVHVKTTCLDVLWFVL
jgi:hypothetical protein